MTVQGSTPELQRDSFTKRVFIALLMAALAYACWRLADLSVVIFGSILFAVGLRAAAEAVSRRTGAANTLALVIVALVVLAGFGLAIVFFGSVIAGQINDLVKEVPKGFQIIMERIQANPFGRHALEQAKSFDVAGQTGWISRTFALIARSTMEAVGYAALIIFVSIYLAAEPERYRRLCLRLLPAKQQPAVSRVFNATGEVLRRWLLGQAKKTSLPPVLSLLSVVVFGVLLGPSSVLIAAPLTLFLIVAVEVLYVEDALGKEPEVTKKDPE